MMTMVAAWSACFKCIWQLFVIEDDYLLQVIDDSDLVPGWEGKIVAWVEDDTGQKLLSNQEQNMS